MQKQEQKQKKKRWAWFVKTKKSKKHSRLEAGRDLDATVRALLLMSAGFKKNKGENRKYILLQCDESTSSSYDRLYYNICCCRVMSYDMSR